MLSSRLFRVFSNNQSSCWKRLKNVLPQGSVLAPILFSIYTSDLPITQSIKFMYADDLVLAIQCEDFETGEII